MGLAQDLLNLADHLATHEGRNPSQASLRRAVSTAYYSLFHLLIEEAARLWQGSAEWRTGLERGFQHGSMQNTSRQFVKLSCWDWHGNQQHIPPALRQVASAFVALPAERHTADYDNHEQWIPTDVKQALNTTPSPCHNCQSIRT